MMSGVSSAGAKRYHCPRQRSIAVAAIIPLEMWDITWHEVAYTFHILGVLNFVHVEHIKNDVLPLVFHHSIVS
jgi:hypothetical protein